MGSGAEEGAIAEHVEALSKRARGWGCEGRPWTRGKRREEECTQTSGRRTCD
jgi:hypothetical protein